MSKREKVEITPDEVGEVSKEEQPEAKVEPKLVRMTDDVGRITVDQNNKPLYDKLVRRGWKVIEDPPEGVFGNMTAALKVHKKALEPE